MNRPSLIRQQGVVWAFVFGIWILMVLAFSGQLVFSGRFDWPEALRLSLRNWLPWAALAPATIWLAGHFPLERRRLAISVPVHLAACVLAVLFSDFMLRPGPPEPNPPPPPGRDEGPPMQPDLGPGEPPPFRRPLPGGSRRADRFLPGLAMRAQSTIPIYWVLVSIVHALSYSRRSQERELHASELEKLLAEARLDALRMQLHPHFLFNTLNAIATLVHKDPAAADEMIANLSELLRATLDTSEEEIPLRREMEFLNRYLEIQQVRFGDRLQVERAIDATAMNALVPPLILQPLVENAVRHGIEPQAERGSVEVRAERDGAVLRLTVKDTGAGIKTRDKTVPGIGLSNTTGRLQELYGAKGRLTLTSGAGGGFTVVLELPFHETPLLRQVTEEPA